MQPSNSLSQSPQDGAITNPKTKVTHLCSTCKASFRSSDDWRAHKKSSWHVENLRRQVAGMPPLDPPSGDNPNQGHTETAVEHVSDDSQDSDVDLSSNESSDDDASEDLPEFVAGQCLFCDITSENVPDSLEHMRKLHGLFIPEPEHLVVSLESLIRYLHLVIFGYRECLYCHTERRTAEAVQQHMTGKGHCKFDISNEDSEFLDFYDFDQSSDYEEEEQEGVEVSETGPTSRSARASAKTALTEQDGSSVRLPSGKILSHRTSTPARAKQVKNRQHAAKFSALMASSESVEDKEESGSKTNPASQARPASTALTRSEKNVKIIENQLARLTTADRMSLAHLSAPEQRAVLLRQKKQMDKERRHQRRYQSRMEIMNNQLLMKHFKSDVPGPKLG